mmetsp:Transcript_8038/g.17631  ORF Transcript_8038/g.17631 Transcript_8038/m.17631 type:complete len:211 (-) Transcript_8038:153-785(-)
MQIAQSTVGPWHTRRDSPGRGLHERGSSSCRYTRRLIGMERDATRIVFTPRRPSRRHRGPQRPQHTAARPTALRRTELSSPPHRRRSAHLATQAGSAPSDRRHSRVLATLGRPRATGPRSRPHAAVLLPRATGAQPPHPSGTTHTGQASIGASTQRAAAVLTRSTRCSARTNSSAQASWLQRVGAARPLVGGSPPGRRPRGRACPRASGP